MPTSNEKIQDRFISHQVYLLRYAQGLSRRYKEILNNSLPRLRDYFGRVLPRMSAEATRNSQRLWNGVSERVGKIRGDAMNKAQELSFSELDKLAVAEAAFTAKMINDALPFEYGFKKAQVQNLARYATYEGLNLGQWWERMKTSDHTRIMAAARNGVAQGLTNTQVATNIRAAVSTTNNAAEMLARTTTNGLANAAKEEFYKANADVVDWVVWVATLDGRTSTFCAATDGERWRVDQPHPTPPAHPNCRSLLVPALDGIELIGDRPAVGGTNFRTLAREKAGDKWKNYSPSQKASATARARRNYAKDVVGSVPAKTTYSEWLRRQPASFQDEVLGKTKAQWFREGEVTLDGMVNPRTLKPLTIDEIRQREGL